MSSVVHYELNAQVGVIRVDNPPVNALSQAVRQGLMDCLNKALADQDCQIIVIHCEGRTFIAGADISEFGKPPLEPHLPDVLASIEGSTKPVVVALHGTALGGGFEVALAGHYRIAIRGAKVGLPEVSLGLIPGSGGTQRLPRLIGIEKAAEMITTSKPVAAEKLLDTGVIDELVETDLLDSTLQYANRLVEQGAKPRPVSACNVPLQGNEEEVLASFKANLAKRARGQQAPQLALESIANTLTLSFDEGMRKEREFFLTCRESPQSRAMRHAFFAERAAAKIDVDRSVEPLPVKKIGVIGAGTMGSGIAMCFASAGYQVRLLEMANENLQRGLEMIRERYQQSVDRGRLSDSAMTENLERIKGTCDYLDFDDVDLVVEAAFESMQVKTEIFRKLDEVCKSEAILATNTSYLIIDDIASATSRPDKVVGMHFFSPAHVMKLLEVVQATKTSDQSLVTAMDVGKKIGKISVAVGLCYGFVGNRMYARYGREANQLLLEGATPSQIDQAMQNWGMAMGPLAVADMSGIDIGYKARRERIDPPNDPLYFLAADLMVDSGRLGQKTGAGFYRYEDGKKQDDGVVTDIIRKAAGEAGVNQRDLAEEEIQQRLIFALINEGGKILEEGIARRASDIDVIWLNGYGFPRYRGGPMCYADEIGLDSVLAGIRKFCSSESDIYWQPSTLLARLAESGDALATFEPSKS
jgi:3-hydroxyacyl-CoA dehydrogenase